MTKMKGSGKQLVEQKLHEIVHDEESERATLKDILDDELIQNHGGSREGELSKAQIGLVSTTVSLMQDRMLGLVTKHADQLREQAMLEKQFLVSLAERTNTFRSEMAKLYSIPLITANETGEAGVGKKEKGLAKFFNWGNFLAITTVILAGVSIFFTQAYANHKDRAEVLSASLEDSKGTAELLDQQVVDLEGKLVDAREELDEAVDERDTAKAQFVGLQTQFEALQEQHTALSASTGAEKVYQDQVNKMTGELGRLRRKDEKQTAAITELTRKETEAKSEAISFRELYNQVREENKGLREGLAKLTEKNKELAVELAKVKRRRR